MTVEEECRRGSGIRDDQSACRSRPRLPSSPSPRLLFSSPLSPFLDAMLKHTIN
ncbi:hypothetical protein Syun_014538 [Stephania yunnanensis]|uniref:Uncharacterized protein n=1 Tax=Stephania yunnanensis TaxID=152371 RepID=A0AAP0JJK1_9MAGN